MTSRAAPIPRPGKVPLLRRLNLFEEMGEEEVEAISRQLSMSHCGSGQGIYAGNQNRVYLLKSGSVRLYRLSANGDGVTTAILVPGQLFGTTSFLGGAADGDHADALEDSYICEASAPDFLGIMARHPMLMARVMMAMARLLFHLERTVEQLVHGSVEDRPAGLLVAHMDAAEELDGEIVLPAHTRGELASMVMSTRETVSRTLAKWRREGVVELRGRRVVVLDPANLCRRARGEI